MREVYLSEIKTFEGFGAQAKWDYAQFTNGYGTKARFEGEKIDQAEASRRFTAEIDEARKFVERHAEGWDEGTKAALTSLTFNAGTRWASSGLGDALRSHDIDAVRERFLAYTKAGGADLPGLVKRRLQEATWIGKTGDVDAPLPASTPKEPAAAQFTSGEPVRPPQSMAQSTEGYSIADHGQPPETVDAIGGASKSMASLSLILLALDLAATPSLTSARRGEGNNGSESA